MRRNRIGGSSDGEGVSDPEGHAGQGVLAHGPRAALCLGLAIGLRCRVWMGFLDFRVKKTFSEDWLIVRFYFLFPKHFASMNANKRRVLLRLSHVVLFKAPYDF